MKLLVLVLARGGSKGLPGKNLRHVGGLSLTARAVLAGRQFLQEAGASGSVVVDTDDAAIAAEGRSFGADAPFLRAGELARDDTPTIDSTLGCLERLSALGQSFDAVVLLQPTSPLRSSADVAEVWRAFDAKKTPSVVAITPVEHPIEFAVRRDAAGALSWLSPSASDSLRRQDTAPAYRLTGAVYVSSVPLLRERRAFLIPGLTRGVVVAPGRSVDVDTAEDLATANALARAVGPEPFDLAGRSVGGGRCFVIAEAGVNHNGDVELARRLVLAAAESGADAVKFQTFDPEALASSSAPQAEYQAANTGRSEPQREMLRRLVLPHDAYPSLKSLAEQHGMIFLSTPFDEASADFLERLGVAAFKIPSGELTNIPLVSHIARKGRPVLMSSGMATMAEVGEAVLAARREGSPPLALFHCVTNYPAPAEDCNLSAMDSMRAAFGAPVGWSDHTAGTDISIAAAAMGADLLEKHLTLDRTLPGPDHMASLEPDEFRSMVEAIRRSEAARGNGDKAPVKTERAFAEAVRKSLHARRALAAGQVLQAEDVVALRPGTGLPPSSLASLVGRRLATAVPAGALLSERDFG